jgi:polyhydroxybutyrate depolymerase
VNTRLTLPFFLCWFLLAAPESQGAPRVEQQREWSVGGVRRTAVVKLPVRAGAAPAPLVFGWHGHGGTSQGCERWGLEAIWPEAMFVYAQGLPTPGRLTDPEGKRSGWQAELGAMEDRDLKLFDAMLADLRSAFFIDNDRIYCTGHSNGGGMTYLLAEHRSGVFAAIAPCASSKGRRSGLGTPIPVIHILGENDRLVKPDWQRASIEVVKRVNGCSTDGMPWGGAGGLLASFYHSTKGTPLVVATHRGGHEYPQGAAELIVRFFKDHSLQAR